ncbi:UbiA prenyltransferase [Daldinia caldariorum]|uniref:UbiA prenyltransferase n=1 Tax=Daldinia caldariorum TaxID=326644 RepID=UPI0020084F68|nr:UbiA prenyltransferase [Daldinia caldariorum]KAI1466789.1 UbiA prenyltransferase [Daldinia caldariorum]
MGPVRKPEKPEKPSAHKVVSDHSLSQQYGGVHGGGWVSHLPSSWAPYIQLARLSPPAGLFLIFFPHLFGILHAAALQHSPPREVARASVLLLGASFFFSNAIHAWNDLVDAPVDRMVARTQHRPIVRGAVSPRAAFVFTASQAFAAALFLPLLPAETSRWALANIPAVLYYPWAKRHTHFAQVVLGLWLGWGSLVGSSAMGLRPSEESPSLYLLAVCILWTTIYDTVYAHQDVADDKAIGLKSMAVLFGNRTKLILWPILGLVIVLLTAVGVEADLGLLYFILAVGGCASSLGAMIAMVELGDSYSCWLWFKYGFWFTGGFITAGLASASSLFQGLWPYG